MYDQIYKRIDDTLWKDAGCGSELDYVEQSSWILFLKYLDDLEQSRAAAAELDGRTYAPIIERKYRWSTWAVPKKNGEKDLSKTLTGDDLLGFVRGELFPYLRAFKTSEASPDTLQYKIGEIFSGIQCKLTSGYVMRDVFDEVDNLRFQSSEDQHEMSSLYEIRISRMGNAGRNGGEYYTPRPLIRSIIAVLEPKIGERIYDGACGSAGFLCEAFAYLIKMCKTAKDRETLQKRMLFGKEKKALPFIIGTMNMILHGVEAPNILLANTLAENLANIQPSQQVDLILANPPFGSNSERGEIKENFTIKTGETAYMFLEHFIRMLKPGGRAGVVIKNTFLSNGDATALRKMLLSDCNLFAVLDLPQKVFTAGVKTVVLVLDLPQKVFTAGVKTVVLFFEKGRPTTKTWFYQLNLDRTLGKTNPLTEDDLAEFRTLFKKKCDSANSWTVDIADLDPDTLDLTVRNPNAKEEKTMRAPREIAAEMAKLDKSNAALLADILKALG